MIAKIRHLIFVLLPVSIRWPLLKCGSEIVNFISKTVQGINDLWEEDEEFISLYNSLSKRVILYKRTAYILYKLSKNCATLDGNFAELGVFKGAGSRLMFEATKGKKNFYLFDTFEGHPSSNNIYDKYWRKGDLGETSLEYVKELLAEDNFYFFKGKFPETAKDVPENLEFAFVHIDPDLYQPVLDACYYFYPKMVRGGMMLFDDYGLLSCRGVKMAVDEFFADKLEEPVDLTTGQCLIVKR